MRRAKSVPVINPWAMFTLGAMLFAAGVTLVILHAAGVFKGEQGQPGVNGTNGVNGTGSSGSSYATEAFSVALRSPFVFNSGGVYEPITNFTSTVDTDFFPDVAPSTLFLNLNTDSMNMATGVYTVGLGGVYVVTFPLAIDAPVNGANFQMTINGAGLGTVWQNNDDIRTEIIYFPAGAQVQIRGVTSDIPTTIPIYKQTSFSPPKNGHSFIWSAVKVAKEISIE